MPTNDIDNEKIEMSGEFSSAVKYVNEVLEIAIVQNVTRLTITSVDGFAKCDCSAIRAKFKEVRNRLCIMTDTIETYRSFNSAMGKIEVCINGVTADVVVNVYPKDDMIKLEINGRR